MFFNLTHQIYSRFSFYLFTNFPTIFFALFLAIHLSTLLLNPLPFHVSTCQSFHLFIYLSHFLSFYRYFTVSVNLYLFYINLFIILSKYLYLYISIYLSLHHYIHLYIYQIFYVSIYSTLYLSIHPTFSLSMNLYICRCIYFSLYLSAYLSIYLSIYLHIKFSV